MPTKSYPLDDIENVLPILNKIALFGALTEKQLYTVFRLLEKASLKAGEYVFRQEDEPRNIWIIRKGKVKIVADSELGVLELAELGVGECLGETAVIGIQPHTASALAVEDTELMSLSRAALLSIFDQDKELFGFLMMNIAREACRRLGQADEVLLHYVLRKPH
ncbi:MAG: cyclic nucleotide-binding domain-containing protein [Candidatus Omnitrophota bacterium]|nr:cyclic nucleotide-binding domain-containing protein [Candidatus Omnitrophota bacterium]